MGITTRVDFAQFQTPTLILLVGKNPLPNYVAAQLLLPDNGTLYLVHSTGEQGTGKIAQRLLKYFPQPRYRSQLIPVDLLNTEFLRREVCRYLAQVPDGSIGLNYTGGTKVMAVHVYRALNEFCQQSRRESVFSYLDADTLELSVEPSSNHPAFRRKVAHSVKVTLENLFDLHDIRLRGRLQREPVLPELAQALAQMYATMDGIMAWRKCRELLKAADNRPWSELSHDLQDAVASRNVLTQLDAILNLDKEHVNLHNSARAVGLKTKRELGLWFEGEWLEYWALTCIKNLGYAQRAQNIECYLPSKFQIDVAVMHGYQLFTLSCGVTDNPRKAKLKLLEIYTRARQLGGDEACVGLVSAVEDARGLEQQVIREWDARNRTRVFGRDHLPNLEKHLNAWFEMI